jgi:hypothetical protein
VIIMTDDSDKESKGGPEVSRSKNEAPTADQNKKIALAAKIAQKIIERQGRMNTVAGLFPLPRDRDIF